MKLEEVKVREIKGDLIEKKRNGKCIYKMEDGRVKVCTLNDMPSMTDQQWKDETDVNKIIEKHKKVGVISHLSKKQGQYADMSNISSLQESLIKIQSASMKFKELPQELRDKIHNDPLQLEGFLTDPKNNEYLESLGLKSSKKAPDKDLKGEPDASSQRSESKGDSKESDKKDS